MPGKLKILLECMKFVEYEPYQACRVSYTYIIYYEIKETDIE